MDKGTLAVRTRTKRDADRDRERYAAIKADPAAWASRQEKQKAVDRSRKADPIQRKKDNTRRADWHVKKYEADPAFREKVKKQLNSLYRRPEQWAKVTWRGAKARAEEAGLPFDIEPSDIVLPERCPVLGLELKVGGGRNCPTSPSLDKIVPALGYVKGNVRVISWRANELKGNGTVEEIEAVLRYMKGEV